MSTTTTTEPATRAADHPGTSDAIDPTRRIDRRRLRSAVTWWALVLSAVAAVGQTLGTVVAGRLAESPTTLLVWLLALCVVGAALLNTIGRTMWSAVVDRAEGKLRADLLDAALHQPLEALNEQAVGEILDRIDDDTHEIGALLRRQIWDALRTVFAAVPMWVVAGITWWPAWILFPLFAGLAFWLVKGKLPEIGERTVVEEMAWTDHAAAMEEGVTGRDDLRTSLGQAHVVRRLARLSGVVHRRFDELLLVQVRVTRRTGVILHALLAGIALGGIAMVIGDGLSVARLVTLFLVTSTFVGQVDMMARHLPDIQAGLGALTRLRQLAATEPEPVGGLAVPPAPLDLELRDLHFSYAEGTFALRDVDLYVPAGQTCALVGRTGSGKSTLASLLSRAVDPAPGTVFLGGVDVLDLDLQELRAAVGVVTQRTEILVGTLVENITLFADLPRQRVIDALAELGLTDWVAGLPDGLDTDLGPGGTTLSAGEEQLVAFARLLVRDVSVVVLDEATARMDPLTEALVVRASERLLRHRTGLLVAHRLSTVARADLVAVLEAGQVVQQGPRVRLATEPGRFRDLLEAGGDGLLEEHTATDEPDDCDQSDEPDPSVAGGTGSLAVGSVGGLRRTGAAPVLADPGDGPSLARGMLSALTIKPSWGAWAAFLFLLSSVFGAFGAVTGYLWGTLVERLQQGAGWDATTVALTVAVTGSLLAAPLVLGSAIRRYPRWWVEVMLRVRMAVLFGQTRQHRLTRTPAGEVVARSMDADRYARYADRWVDFINGAAIVVFTAIAGGSLLAGAVLLAVMVGSALASALGRPIAGRSAAESSAARARFGRSLVSALESARTVKLAAATPAVHRHLRQVDSGRVEAAVFEHRVQAILDGVPIVMVQCGVVAAWATYFLGGWGLATAILVAGAVNGFDWFGRVAGAVVTEAPGTRAWQKATARLAGGVDLMTLPPEVDLVRGEAPAPTQGARVPLRSLELRGLTAVHDDGTRGVVDVDLDVESGELVLLLGQVGSGKSSLLAALAGLVEHEGEIRWNGVEVDDAQAFLRPGQIAHVAQVPRVLSGTFADNIALGHLDRDLETAVADARLGRDVGDAGGVDAVVGHRGVRLSGGQVQRLALARALAADTEVLLADDVSSALDAATEVELWGALRSRGTTVIGATSKRAALAQADRVVVLVAGEVAAVGTWRELAPRWGHLAG
ncbi:ABC transporter ATP-binding protein [Nocardioides sp. GXZ039]|uniref:ABC transporter ATP-binding protein n=1 Tax=Nocardioides sp. GXZ039 TaxID=3136018 RepID=UPI0030F3FEFF